MQSKRSLMNVVVLAAAGAATSWLVNYWLDHRVRSRKREKRELKEQIRTWEDEGGSLAPPAERRDLATH
jgi:hypothetical protein